MNQALLIVSHEAEWCLLSQKAWRARHPLGDVAGRGSWLGGLVASVARAASPDVSLVGFALGDVVAMGLVASIDRDVVASIARAASPDVSSVGVTCRVNWFMFMR